MSSEARLSGLIVNIESNGDLKGKQVNVGAMKVRKGKPVGRAARVRSVSRPAAAARVIGRSQLVGKA